MRADVKFSERIRTEPLPLAMLGGFGFLEICLAVKLPDLPRWGVIMHLAFAAFCLVVLILFREFQVLVTAEKLTFGFGPVRKSISLTTIRTALPSEGTLATTGIGIHRTRDGAWAWVPRPGPAVLIVIDDKQVSKLIVSTNRPLDLADAVRPGHHTSET